MGNNKNINPRQKFFAHKCNKFFKKVHVENQHCEESKNSIRGNCAGICTCDKINITHMVADPLHAISLEFDRIIMFFDKVKRFRR